MSQPGGSDQKQTGVEGQPESTAVEAKNVACPLSLVCRVCYTVLGRLVIGASTQQRMAKGNITTIRCVPRCAFRVW